MFELSVATELRILW